MRNGAVQFKAEALSAVALLDETVKREVAPPVRTRVEADNEFAEIILAIIEDPDRFLGSESIEFAGNPYAYEPGSEAAEQVQLIENLNRQYTAFGDAFEDLEQGFLFSAAAVEAAGPTAKRLTSQLVVFAKQWKDNPPRFIQRRTTILNALEDVASDSNLSADIRRQRLAELGEAWAKLRAEETEAQRKVIEQCLKAATVGMQVQQMIDDFDKVSLKDIQNTIDFALQTASALTGSDFSDLSTQADALFSTLESDPVWSESIEVGLALATGREPELPAAVNIPADADDPGAVKISAVADNPGASENPAESDTQLEEDEGSDSLPDSPQISNISHTAEPQPHAA